MKKMFLLIFIILIISSYFNVQASAENEIINISPSTSIYNCLGNFIITGGALLGNFDVHRNYYHVNADDTNSMPVITPAMNSCNVFSYSVKQAQNVGEDTVVTFVGVDGDEYDYTFTITVLEEGLYPYFVKGPLISTYGVAMYKKSDGLEIFYMICAMYDSNGNTLKKVSVVTMAFYTGLYAYDCHMIVPDGHYVSLMFFKDLNSIQPFGKVINLY